MRPLSNLKGDIGISKYSVYQLEPNLELINLIMEKSPMKYDLTKLNEKHNKLDKFFTAKNGSEIMSKTDKLFYKYNLLYGSNSNEIIRSYSPKMRPDSPSTCIFK